MKTAEKQAEDQRQLLHVTEINLATKKQVILDLKATLQKAKDEVQLAKEAVEAEKRAAYQLGAEEMEARLTEELLEVCRDYCSISWAQALNAAGIPVDSSLRMSSTLQRSGRSLLMLLKLPSSLRLFPFAEITGGSG